MITAAHKRSLSSAAFIYAAVLAIGFVAAPHSCEWGLTAYVWTGLLAIPAAFAVPFVMQRGATVPKRLLWGFAYVILSVAVWFAGLAVANVRVVCRLF